MIDYVAFVLAVTGAAAAPFWVWRRVCGAAASPAALAARSAVIIAVVLPLTAWGAWRLSNARSFQVMGSIVPRVTTTDSVIALTFDDGPVTGPTERILEILAEHDARATFFLIGSAMELNPEAAARIVEAGHEVGNHSYSHPMMLGLSLDRIRSEIRMADERLRDAGYTGDIHFRSPYAKKFVALPYVLARAGRHNILWDVEPETFPDVARDSDRIAQHVLERARPGSIILMHIMSAHYAPSLEAVPVILGELEDRGYRFVTVSELLELGPDVGDAGRVDAG